MYSVQLMNEILCNGKFYYRDMIRITITITCAKGKGNAKVYHIEVRDLPFHTIWPASCFLSLIDNTKIFYFIEK